MADLKRITLPSGTTYNLVDQGARDLIAQIEAGSAWIGVTTTPLTDGATTNPVVINGESVTAKTGNMTAYGSKEFIFNGTAWQELGDMSMLGELAYKDSASGSFTPAGSVSKPTFTGTRLDLNVNLEGGVTFRNWSQTFTGTEGNISADFTPAGTVSKPTFTGTEGNVSASFTPAGNVTISKGTGTANYTPQGTVSTPTITVTPNTATVNSITAVGSLPELTMTVANETLTFGWDAGSLPTKGSNQTVVTGIQSATSSQPSFTGTGAELKATFSGTAGTATGKFTPAGSVSQPTFTGTEGSVTGTFTPAGSVSAPTYTASSVAGQISFTPAGEVSKPTFTGTAGTVEVE